MRSPHLQQGLVQLQQESYFSAVLDSFKVEAEKHGYDITFINHNISGKSMSYLEHCRYRNVDGVVTVSYTHLDVYKRQGLVSIRYNGVQLLDDTVRPNFWRAPTNNDEGCACLLYTSKSEPFSFDAAWAASSNVMVCVPSL